MFYIISHRSIHIHVFTLLIAISVPEHLSTWYPVHTLKLAVRLLVKATQWLKTIEG